MIRMLAIQAFCVATVISAGNDGKLPTAESVGKFEVVAVFHGPKPTGVTVSHKGRIFVNFPRWGDPVDFTVAELKGGKPVAFPSPEANRFDKGRPGEGLISVQSVV